MFKFNEEKGQLKCSFCGKSQEQVRKLVAGPGVYICDECIELCNEIIEEEIGDEPELGFVELPKPQDIKDVLDQYVIGQEGAKKSLSVAVYNHYKRVNAGQKVEDVELQKSNIVLVGPTGVGKTLLAQTLARILNVPFAIADATSLTEAGYVGEDVENILLKLIQAADYDLEKAEKGIIYIDEIPQGGRKHPHQEFMQIDTTDILFICGGAFDGLEKIIQDRVGSKGIGFGAEVLSRDDDKLGAILKQILPQDLLKYGLIPEFVGRIPVVATLDPLDSEAFVRILKEPRNALIKQYQKIFELDGVSLEFKDNCLEAIAEEAMKRNTGARGLRAILEEILLDVMFDVPSRDDIERCVITKEVVLHKELPMLATRDKRKKKEESA